MVNCLTGIFNTGYPPAQFYTIAGVFSVFGASLLAERIWDTVWRLAIVGLVIVLARAATPQQRAHPQPLVCVGLLTGTVGCRLYPMISGMLPCLAAVWCAVLYLNQRGVRWLFFSGTAAGAAILYRHDLAICVCGAVTVAGLLSGDGSAEAWVASVPGPILGWRATRCGGATPILLVIGAALCAGAIVY
jgi:4-amino-4-deoxy-L-arabinose transferase-like glycosyltransferase